MSHHPATRLPAAVKDDLTPEPPSRQAPTKRPTRRSRGRRTTVENTDYAAFATRQATQQKGGAEVAASP